MVHSDWGEWFVTDELEAVDPDGLSIWFVGCNGFVLRSPETTLYVDPYFGGSVPPRLLRMDPVPVDPAAVTLCDAVLVTHEHIDHMHPPSYGPVVNDLGADLYATDACYDRPDFGGDLRVPASQRRVVEPGAVFDR
jgi:L-ascorbate 6-phosphate lactonase